MEDKSEGIIGELEKNFGAEAVVAPPDLAAMSYGIVRNEDDKVGKITTLKINITQRERRLAKKEQKVRKQFEEYIARGFIDRNQADQMIEFSLEKPRSEAKTAIEGWKKTIQETEKEYNS